MSAEIWITLGGILLLVILSFLFSGTETGMTAASRARLHSLAAGGDHLISLPILLAHRLARVLSTVPAPRISPSQDPARAMHIDRFAHIRGTPRGTRGGRTAMARRIRRGGVRPGAVLPAAAAAGGVRGHPAGRPAGTHGRHRPLRHHQAPS